MSTHNICFHEEVRKIFIGLDKNGYHVNIFFLFLNENICCGYSLEVPWKHMLCYSLEVPWLGSSNEYPQHMFSWRNKKNINTFGLKKASYQEL